MHVQQQGMADRIYMRKALNGAQLHVLTPPMVDTFMC